MNAAEFEEKLSDPARWDFLRREFVHGGQWAHDTERLLCLIVLELSSAIMDLPVRFHPRIRLTRSRRVGGGIKRSLSVTISSKTWRLPLSYAPGRVKVGDVVIPVNNAGGPLRLVSKLAAEIARLWDASHKTNAAPNGDVDAVHGV